MKKTVFLLMLITIISQLTGFIREFVLSYFYGASEISDSYIVSTTIPSVLFNFIVVAISANYIPLYIKVKHSDGEEAAFKFTNNILSILIIIAIIVIILTLFFTKNIVRIFAMGFDSDTLNLAIKFTKISIFSVLSIGTFIILKGILNSNNVYLAPALTGLPMNIITIICILISAKTNPLVLAIGSVIASAAQIVFLYPSLQKIKFKYKFYIDLRDKNVLNVIRRSLSVIIGSSVKQINKLIDQTIASMVAIGGISALNYASTINGLVQAVFVLTILPIIYPKISRMAIDKDMDNLKRTVNKSVVYILLFILPATVGAIVLAKPIVGFLFGRGAFDEYAIDMTAKVLVFYSIGISGFGLREILTKTFYALEDTKTPMLNGVIGVLINVALNLILSKYLGIGGLALATSISALSIGGLLLFSLKNKIGSLGLVKVINSLIKILCASLIMGFAVNVSYNYLIDIVLVNKYISLLCSICLGIIVYIVMVYILRINEVNSMLSEVKMYKKVN